MTASASGCEEEPGSLHRANDHRQTLLRAASEDEWDVPAECDFPPLPSLTVLRQHKYGTAAWKAEASRHAGPTSRSSWVLRDMLLTGGMPKSSDELQQLLDSGCTTFFNLTQNGEGVDYRKQLKRLAGSMHPRPRLRFDEQPIVDQCATADEQAAAAALRIVRRCVAGEVVYLHCRGGHGRTGIIASLVLGLAYDVGAVHALALYQILHDCREQRNFALKQSGEGARALELAPSGAPRGRSQDWCVCLFEEQRTQVERLLSPTGTARHTRH